MTTGRINQVTTLDQKGSPPARQRAREHPAGEAPPLGEGQSSYTWQEVVQVEHLDARGDTGAFAATGP